MTTQPKKKAGVPARDRHLQPNPHNLLRGGKKPREILTPLEIDFCSFYAQTGRITLAGRYACIPQNQTTQIFKRPLIQKTIAEFAEKFKSQALERDAQRLEERKEVTHREFVHRLQTMKTHKYRGDDAAAKMCEIGFKSTGEIQAARVTATAGAQAASIAQSGIYAKRLYLPDWRKEAIEKLQHDERRASGAAVPNGTELQAGE